MSKNRGEMPDKVKLRCATMRAQGVSWEKIAAAVGYPKSVCQKWGQRWAGFVPVDQRIADDKLEDATVSVSDTGGEKSEWTESGDKATLTGDTRTPVRSEEDVYRAFSVDRTRWKIVKMRKKAWEVMAKVGNEKDGYRLETRQMYGVTADLVRVMPKVVMDATDAIFERMAKHAPKYDAIKPTVVKGGGDSYMLSCLIPDAHFGKMAWGLETGENYDLKIAERVYRNAVEDLMQHWSGRPIERVVLPIGNDHVHIDNSRNTTFAGTPQDVDGRYAKVIESAEMAVIWAVERLMQTAPVSVMWVPGNHDPTTSFHLARTVQAWFRNCDRVTVDVSPSPRKYVAWGKTLIGMTHGSEEKHDQLPTIMATEMPREWSQATCREWYLGHMHRSRQWVTKPVDTHTGVTVRVIRSPASSDAWHHRKGYIGGIKGSEAYLYSKKLGYIGHAVAPVRGG